MLSSIADRRDVLLEGAVQRLQRRRAQRHDAPVVQHGRAAQLGERRLELGRRDARARVDVVLARSDRSIDITVTDSGGALGPATPLDVTGAGRGLIGMRERAAVYGGRVDAGRYDGGWRVHAVLETDEEER